tara:strand:+ start:274 stop:1188 length:915 start_codon:yes stop_codon:yes gene_type:complete
MGQVIQASEVSEVVTKEFDFSVDKFPLFLPDNQRTPLYGLTRSDTGEIVEGTASKTKQYIPHTTEDIVALAEAASECFDGDIVCDAHFRSGHFIALRPTNTDRREVYNSYDPIWPSIVISAGFDGKAVIARCGYWRDNCLNLAMMSQIAGTKTSIRHNGNMRIHMDSLLLQFKELKSSWDNVYDAAMSMQQKTVKIDDFFNKIFTPPTAEELKQAKKDRKTKNWDNRNTIMKKRIEGERNKMLGTSAAIGDSATVWELYNAVQGYFQHDSRKKVGFKSEFDGIIRSANQAEVKSAEKLALELAA